MSDKKTNIVLVIITIAVFLVAVLGATYAYFASSTNIDANIGVNVETAASMYSFSATSNGNIELNISFTDMSEANVSTEKIKTGNANINVSLASPSEDVLTRCTYDIVWVWDSDDKYTMPDVDELPYTYIPASLTDEQIEEYFGSKEYFEETKEWYLKYYGEDAWNQMLMDYEIAEYYYYEFSIMINNTNETDLSKLELKDNKVVLQKGVITSNSTTATEKVYNIEANIYNLPVEQKKLFAKNFKAHVTIDNLLCNMTDISNAQTLAIYITENVYTSSDNQTNISNGAAGLYLHNSSLVNGAGDNSYRYAGGYNFPKATDSAYNTLANIVERIKGLCYDGGHCYTLTYDDTDTKYTYDDAINKAIEDGYLEEINNYVCFQEDTNEDGTCADDDLYRIISVNNSNNVKLIKATSVGEMQWNEIPEDYDESYDINIWEGSDLERYLNSTSNEEQYNYVCEDDGDLDTCQKVGYLYSLGSKASLIEDTTWSVGGASISDLQEKNVHDFMQVELNNITTYKAKIGLMYAADYGYAALPEYWTNDLKDYDESIQEKDWMYYYDEISSADGEWTISRDSGEAYFVLSVSIAYYVSSDEYASSWNAVRPSFNLKSNVKILNAGIKGVGTKNKPMIVG